MPHRSRSAGIPAPGRLACILLAVVTLLLFLAPTAFAKTYVITDGDRVITYTTFATSPEAVPEDAGMELEAHDSYTTQGGDAITIRRGQQVCLVYRGEAVQVSSSGETVGQLLARLDLEITEQDSLSHPPETPVYDGMELRIDHTVTRQEVYTSTIPHETTLCADSTLPRGTEEILIEGRDGELLHTANVTYLNGREIHREVLSETQTIAPITQITAQGTADLPTDTASDMPIIEDGYIIMPTGEILTYYKTDYVTATGYTHTDAGCDMITSTGTTVHYGTVAVDPRFIPYGTRMLIVSHDGERYYGIATAEDCGGAIKRDKMDLYFPTYEECIEFGRRRCTIYFLG